MDFNELLIKIGIGVAIPAILGIVAKIWPKEKAKNTIGPVFRKFGKLLSTLGNSRLGSKSMNAIEEGPISTIVACVIHAANEFSAGLAEDNVKEKVKEQIPKEISDAFNEAVK